MLDQTQEINQEINWDELNNPASGTFDLFGKVELSAWKGAYEKGTRGSVPYDPARHQKSHIAIDIFVQPLPEIDVKYPKTLEVHLTSWDREWRDIVLASIKALGIEDVREINDKWARVSRVRTGETYSKKDAQGNPTGEIAYVTTFKFVEFFADEDACRAAYVAAGGAPANGGANGNGNAAAPTQSKEDAERQTALQFLTVIVQNAVRGVDKWDEAKAAVGKALEQYPTVTKFFNQDSPETADLMTQANDKLLPF